MSLAAINPLRGMQGDVKLLNSAKSTYFPFQRINLSILSRNGSFMPPFAMAVQSFGPHWLACRDKMHMVAARSYKYHFFFKSLIINYAFIDILSIMR